VLFVACGWYEVQETAWNCGPCTAAQSTLSHVANPSRAPSSQRRVSISLFYPVLAVLDVLSTVPVLAVLPVLRIPPEAQRVEESTPEPSAATANHKRGISDVTTRSEREQQREQESPAARHGGRCVGASELEGLGVRGGEEAQGISKGRIPRARKIRAPRRPQRTNCSSS
jgi:hypothetical protein